MLRKEIRVGGKILGTKDLSRQERSESRAWSWRKHEPLWWLVLWLKRQYCERWGWEVVVPWSLKTLNESKKGLGQETCDLENSPSGNTLEKKCSWWWFSHQPGPVFTPWTVAPVRLLCPWDLLWARVTEWLGHFSPGDLPTQELNPGNLPWWLRQ